MGTETAIAWTDHTFNPWIGCSKVHTGCTHCYAESFAKRYGKAEWGAGGTRVLTSDANWRLPLKWNRDAEKAGVRAKVFCASLADVFEDWQGEIHGGGKDDGVLAIDDERSRLLTMDDVRARLFAMIDATPNLDWLLLTKRPENIGKMWCSHVNTDGLPPSKLRRENVWLGTSVSDQVTADKAIPELLKCRDLAPVLFLSAEPLVGPIDLSAIPVGHDVQWNPKTGGDTWANHFRGRINWIIFGGESGHGARPCVIEWLRKGVEQCRSAGVAPFVKQLGGYVVDRNDVGYEGDKQNAWPMDTNTSDLEQGWQGQLVRVHLRDKKGGDMPEWPEDLRVQEFPR